MNINVNNINSVVEKWLNANSATYNILNQGEGARWVTEYKEICPEEFQIAIKLDIDSSEETVTNYFLDQLKLLVTKDSFVTIRPIVCCTRR